MDRNRYQIYGGVILALAALFWAWLPVDAATNDDDWLRISGEKGFFFNYLSGANPDSLNPWDQGFSFTQSFLLDLEGEFGNGYTLQGHLVDLPNAPGQLFLEIKGEHAGMRFGDGVLGEFNSPLTNWSGSYNGLAGYLKNNRSQLNLVYANPTALAYRESILFKTGQNYAYLTYQPIKEGSLQVRRQGELLTEGFDYQINYFSGKLELLFYPSNELQLDLEYQYAVSEVLGNQFTAISQRNTWGNYSFGFDYFGSQANNDGEPLLLGEVKQATAFNLGGLNFGLKSADWKWDLEYWSSMELSNGSSWDYLDNMEGSAIETDLFVNSTDPLNWYSGSSGSGRISLNITPLQDLQHIINGVASLEADFQLQRNGDSVAFYHDFGSDRDFNLIEELSVFFYGQGQDLKIEMQLITNENNYYYSNFRTNGDGWVELNFPLDLAKLSSLGLPDLSKIRYLKFVISSPDGNAVASKVYFAPFKVINRSSAEQRWSELSVSPGSNLSVSSEPPYDPLDPLNPDQEHNLKLNYNLINATGWASVSYQPFVVIDASSYSSLKLLLRSSAPVRVSLFSERGQQEYLLAEFDLLASGWQEYTASLAGIPKRVLERMERLTIRLSNSAGGAQELGVDQIRVCDRVMADADAVKMKGNYQSGAWRNQVELTRYNPGFHDLDKAYNYQNQNLRNLTEFNGAEWRFRSDLQSYSQGDLANGYPLDGNRFEVALGRGGTNLSLFRSNEAVIGETDPGLQGERTESKLVLNQQWADWNFDLKRRTFQDDLTGTTDDTTDTVTLRYQRNTWWAMGQVWRESALNGQSNTNTDGSNYGFGYDPPGINRFQLNGGTVQVVSGDGDYSRYFWQSDLAYAVTKWLQLNGNLKDFRAPEGDRESLIADYTSHLSLLLTPDSAFNIRVDQNWRDWTLLSNENSRQYTQDYQSSYHWGTSERLTVFLRLEELTAITGATNGSRYGLNTDLIILKPWLTQLAAEFNGNQNDTVLLDSEQSSYNLNLKNSLQQQEQLFYWGAWSDGNVTGETWDRRMLQVGWEDRLGKSWRYGLRLDAGQESNEDGQALIWGAGGFLHLNQAPHYLEFNLRRQTYSYYPWILSLDYRVLKGDLYSLNLHGDYQQNLISGRDLIIRADLLFYLR